jgi:aspartyl-tRNA(Asn)/glutamyl-tRNA(Gln) amidotransferase subunit B
MKKRQLTVGLEIHVELKTRTKMFCDCLNDPDETHPNINICAVCTAHPGTLPVPNKKAIELVLKLGMALGGTVFPKGRSKFDRKNYFYPDLPKGYQISQYDEPLVLGGSLNGVRITRIHLEEDAGSLSHVGTESLVDFNRAGAPLMEIVTEPDIRSAEEAAAFGEELRRVLRYLEISDADMEKGLMRIEANISIDMGTKVEVKNINSFKAVEGAIAYEYARHYSALEKGEKIIQETRGWNAEKGITISQRTKEDAHDYRYFPEPDIPPLSTEAFDLEAIKISIPELPHEKRARFMAEYGIRETDAFVVTEDRAAAEFFENAASELTTLLHTPNYALLLNYFTSDLWGILKKDNIPLSELRLTPAHFAQLVAYITNGTIGSRGAKDALIHMIQTGASAETTIEEKGLRQISDTSSLEATVLRILEENPKAREDWNKGKQEALNFLVGRAMKELKGTGNPVILKELFQKLLK